MLAGSSLADGRNSCQDNILVHHYRSTCVNAASAWGSQNVIAIAR